MDMLKKARGKAMQAVKDVQKEVQGIIQTPGQQAATYGPSQSSAPYQQYGQQRPPQMQSFQSQYAGPNQSHPQAQGQYQYAPGTQQPQNAPQYSQYGQTHSGHQSPPVPQSYNQTSPQHGYPPQQQQYAPQVNQQYPTAQGPHVHKLPPAYTPQPIQGFQGLVHPSNPQQPHPAPPNQPMQHPQYQSGSPQQYQQNLGSPVSATGSHQYQGTPLSQPSVYSPPAQVHNNVQTSPQQTHYQQQGYFAPGAGQQPLPSPTYASTQALPPQQSQAQHHTPVQQYGAPPPIPQGRPQTTSPPAQAITNAPPQGISHQQHHVNQAQIPFQGRPQTTSPPAQAISSAPPQGVPNQQHHVNVNQVQTLAQGSQNNAPSPPPVQMNRPAMQPPTNTPSAQQNHGQVTQGHSQTHYVQSSSPPPPATQNRYSNQAPQGPVNVPTSSPPSQIPNQNQGISNPLITPQHIQAPQPQPIQQQSQPQSQPPLQKPPSYMQPQTTQQVPTSPPQPSISSTNIPQKTPSQTPQFIKPQSPPPPSPTLTPAPLNLRPRPQSSIQPKAQVSSLPDKNPKQNIIVQQVERHDSPVPASASIIQADIAPQVQSALNQPVPSPTPYKAFSVHDTPNVALTTQANPQSQPDRDSLPGAVSPTSNTQYQPFTRSDNPPSRSTSHSSNAQIKHQSPVSTPPPAPVSPAPNPSKQVQQSSYTAFRRSTVTESNDNPTRTPSTSQHVQLRQGQQSSTDLVSPTSPSVIQNAPFTFPSHHDAHQISPQSTFASPHVKQESPMSVHSTVSSQHRPYVQQDSLPTHPVELAAAPYEMQPAQGYTGTAPVLPQGRPGNFSPPPAEFADGLMLANEDTNFVPVVRSTAARQTTFQPAVVTKTKCAGFEPTLTDTNQYFEMKPDFMDYHKIPLVEGGSFAICEYCFHTYLSPHPWFAGLFHPRPKAPRPADRAIPPISFEKMIGCGLAFPRIRQVILGLTIPTRNLQPFVEYAKIDATLAPCTGAPQGGSYYGSRSIESIAVCSSCFECYIKSTGFERYFSLQKLPSPNQQWACDIGYSGYVHRTLLQDIAKNPPNFGHFVAAANKRLAMPPCTGHKQPIACSGPSGSTIFRSVRDNCGVFCSGCFHDKVVGTPAEHNFGYEIEIDDDQKAALSCDLTFEFSMDAMDNAVKANNFDLWHRPIVASNTPRLCPSITGIDEEDLLANSDEPTWYCFKDYPSIEVCGKCYGTRVVTYQAEELFTPITRTPSPGRIRQCYLSPAKDMHSGSWDPLDYENTTAWRGQYLRNVLHYCMDAGQGFAFAKQAAAHIAALPPPCGSELRKFKRGSGRKFFGHKASNPNDKNDATIVMCEECFLATAKGTPMESFFSADLTTLAYHISPDGYRCSTWSVQTKRRLRQACLTDSFAAYAQYHHQREQVFEALWTSMRELAPLNDLLKQHTANINRQTELNIQMGSLRLAQQLNSQMNATMMGIGGSVAEAAASDYGVRYGNSTVGMNYLTPNGANAAMAQHQAANLPGLNLPMWQNASTDRLTGEVQRRLDIQNELREQWKVLD